MNKRWLLCAMLLGCGDEAPAPTLTSLLPQVLEPSCASSMCHSPTARASDLVLYGSPARVRSSLVDKSLVYPGVPEASPLLHFLRGELGAPPMPPDAPLSDTDIELIERWIAEGAHE